MHRIGRTGRVGNLGMYGIFYKTNVCTALLANAAVMRWIFWEY